MSKSKSKSSRPDSGSSSKPKSLRPWIHMYLIPVIIAVLCIPLCVIGLIKLAGMTPAGLAILYLFAFDGKVSGRMDGNVLMRNGRGRGFVVPALVQNAYTSAIRSTFSDFSQGYRALTQAQIAAWSAFTMTTTNRFGKSIQISGKECYVRLNQNLADINVAAISVPPTLAGANNLSLDGATADVSDAAIEIEFTGTVAGVRYLLFATSPQSAGVTRPSASKFRIIHMFDVAAVSPLDVTAEYTAKYGSFPVAGSKLFFKVVAVNSTTGEKSASSAVVSCVVTA